MNDDTALDNAIKEYINYPKFAKYNNGPTTDKAFMADDAKNIFIFAVLSGMIASISFTNSISRPDGPLVSITTADHYMTRYNAPERFIDPYYRFKTELKNIAENTKNNPNGFFVTITTDFSKVPPLPSVKGKGGGTRVHRETRNRNRNHTRRIRTQRHRYRSVKLAKSRKSRR